MPLDRFECERTADNVWSVEVEFDKPAAGPVVTREVLDGGFEAMIDRLIELYYRARPRPPEAAPRARDLPLAPMPEPVKTVTTRRERGAGYARKYG